MTTRTNLNPSILAMANALGRSLEEVEAALQLVHTGDVALIAKVIAGRLPSNKRSN
jgi:hypothetical protein